MSRVAINIAMDTWGSWWAKKSGDNDVGSSYGLPSQLFPADNWWNANISAAPLSTSPASTAFMEAWPGTYGWFRLFGDDFGIPIVTIGGGQDQVSSGEVEWIDFDSMSYGDESDWSGNSSAWYQGKFPIPVVAITQTGWTEEFTRTLQDSVVGDRHMLVFNAANGYLYEVYNPRLNGSTWTCAATAVWNTATNNYRTQGWTSTDAAGLQFTPGQVRYDEFISGNPITHAHRCCIAHGMNTTPCSRWPATHYSPGSRWSDSYPPVGTRLRLKASFDGSSWSAPAQRLLQSFKDYGLIVADYGTATGAFEVTGTADARWGTWETGYCGELRLLGFAMTIEDWEMVEWGWGHPQGWTDVIV